MDDKFQEKEIERISRPTTGLDFVFREISSGRLPFRISGLEGAAASFFIEQAWSRLGRPLIVITSSADEARRLFRDLLFFTGQDPQRNPDEATGPVLYFPPYEASDFREYISQSDITARRLSCLYALLTHPGPVLLVTTLEALLSAVVPKKLLSAEVEYLVRGEECDRDELLHRLERWGYLRSPLVERFGEYGLRGGILDLYPPLYGKPVRLEFYGDVIDSIRLFNPSTQRSVQDLEELILLPAGEILWEGKAIDLAQRRLNEAAGQGLIPENEAGWLRRRLDLGSPFEGGERWLAWFYDHPGDLREYFPREGIEVWKDPLALERTSVSLNERIGQGFREAVGGRPGIFLEDLPVEDPEGKRGPLYVLSTEGNQDLTRMIREKPSSQEGLKRLAGYLKSWEELGQEVWIVVPQDQQARRLKDILSFYQLEAAYFPELKVRFGKMSGGVRILTGRLSAGFRMKSPDLIFLTDEEIFEPKKEGPGRARKEDIEAFITSLDDLKVGDFVVHKEHGIGRYRGLQHFRLDGWEGEFLFIEYAEGDKLYLPVDRLQGIHKFMGLEGQVPVLDRLGGNHWRKTKARVKKAVEKIARELVELYARRAVTKGFSFSPRDQMFKEFEAAFPFEETPDQLQAIEEVLADMESEKPMDRLVCGDVGYGKTEVALRAAFRAVLDGKQVAFLVPTTVLAEQHYQTMLRRFEGYPVVVGILSRFKTPREQKQTLADLSAGKVDVVVGTHRLLQKDVHFRDLGLVIIDEEHRFGVTHKEKLKQLRTQVDCLTLTATPIPRTLQMSLAGIRDLSSIETPPEDRQSIRTHIIPFDEVKIVEAVRQEMRRGGQIFFVHNRVHNIEAVAHFLRKILPEVRIGVAHGQLPERELERVMLRFIRRELDLLVCTTIIESGLDIPTANTIIINQAHRFGLAQMYQLRGRVGRSREKANAYLVVPGQGLLSADAQKRLKVLMDFSELGAGFKIALHDLRIRGAGHLLGTSQSGHVAAVGYELYMEMLEQAIRELKGTEREEEWEPEIRLRVPAFLPEGYVPDPSQRLSLYKRLASLPNEEALVDLEKEMEDRFGPLPEAAANLLKVLSLKVRMKRIGIEKVEPVGHDLLFSLHPQGAWQAEGLVRLVKTDPKRFRFQGEGRILAHLGEDLGVLEKTSQVLSVLEMAAGSGPPL